MHACRDSVRSSLQALAIAMRVVIIVVWPAAAACATGMSSRIVISAVRGSYSFAAALECEKFPSEKLTFVDRRARGQTDRQAPLRSSFDCTTSAAAELKFLFEVHPI